MPNLTVKPDNRIVLGVYRHFGIEPIGPLIVNKGYRNTSFACLTRQGWLNLLIYKSEPGSVQMIRRANAVGDYLASNGFPARKTHDRRLIRLSGVSQVRFACLYDYLPGKTIPWEAYTRNHLRQLGVTMARMHQLLGGLDDVGSPKATDILEDQLDYMQSYFEDSGVKYAMNTKLGVGIGKTVTNKLKPHLKELSALDVQIALHLDFVRGNVLFEDTSSGPKLSGVIDFEKTAMGSPLIDIARTLAFLLVDSKYYALTTVMRNFLARGYQTFEGNLLSPANQTVFNNYITKLVNHFLLYDFYKFLRHSPYESLNTNQHFTRTKSLLIHKGIVKPTAVL
jgi:Ser/Thr protein kinase RdoA (MazF antagonist)